MTETSAMAAKRTALQESQKETGAVFAELFGVTVVTSYGGSLLEYGAVRGSAGLIDLSAGGAIEVGGKEGIQFLNGLITNNVKTLEKRKGIQAAFLTGHGKVRALARILGLGDEFVILTDPQTHEKVFNYIFPFTYAGDFQVKDVSDGYRTLSVQGPNALQVMKEVCFEPVPDLADHEWIDTIIAGHNVIVQKAAHTGELGYDILTPVDGLADVWDFLLMKGAFHSIRACGTDALDILRIEAGFPVYGIDIDETNMMLETGLVEAVSYTKGCYTGQEAVAMATYRGHVSKKLSGLAVAADNVPAPKDKISRAGKEIGYITSATRSPALGATIALGYVKYGHFEVGNDVEILTSEGSVAASIVDLPFYKSAG
jgi:folate-binding protein YgfZ